MKKTHLQPISSVKNRFIAYFCVFVAGSVFVEAFSQTIVSRNSTPALLFLAVFAAIGGVFMCERNIISRTTAASTMLALAVVAHSLDHSIIPAAHLTTFALAISLLGAQTSLHRTPKALWRTILLGLTIVASALAIVVVFRFAQIVLLRIADASITMY